MKGMRNLSLRLSEEEYNAFNTVCKERGYSKTGKIREFIRHLIKEELESVTISAREWAEIEKGINEIEGNYYLPLEELKRDLNK